MMITARTQKVGLLGWPLGHSLSPVMQNAAFEASNLDYVYLPLSTPPEQLTQAAQGLKALGFVGVNVTIPHKVAIMECLDQIDSSAKLVGAVNTIICQGDRLIGHNTDAGGYIRSLQQAGINVTGRSAVIFGAGGAARAVIAGFVAAHIAAITVGTRDKNKAERMAHLFDGTIPVSGVSWDSNEFAAALSNADIVVNATPLGMYPSTANQPPVRWELLQQSAVISDLIYNPLITGFMAEGIRRGHTVVGGDGMLLEQGALAFELWTGHEAPVNAMRQALMRELKR